VRSKPMSKLRHDRPYDMVNFRISLGIYLLRHFPPEAMSPRGHLHDLTPCLDPAPSVVPARVVSEPSRGCRNARQSYAARPPRGVTPSVINSPYNLNPALVAGFFLGAFAVPEACAKRCRSVAAGGGRAEIRAGSARCVKIAR
jgi:hypothetical protein